MRQARLVIGLVSLIMFLSGSWGAWANAQENLGDPETVIRMIVNANAEREPVKPLAVERKASPINAGVNLIERDFTGE